jgi:uncharacterized 2Fe-2S/4Fe-4S cluster protein (DUF4445 family)
MPSVQFLPAGVVVEVPAGTPISEAAERAGLVNLELPCGGQGNCGQCLVEIVDGAPGGNALVLACQTKVESDLVVRLPEGNDTAMRVVGDSHFLVGEDVLPDRDSLAPLFRVVRLTIPPASIEEHYSDWKRLTRELARTEPGAAVQADLRLLRELAEAVREQDGKVTIGISGSGATPRIEEIRPGHVEIRAFGLAIDIGTTTVAAQLVDLDNGRVLATATSYNHQIRRGSDVISRIDYARNPERQAELRELVLHTINSLIAGITDQSGVNAQDVRAAFVAGNTTMIHLLLGLPPRYIRETPYVPTVNPVPALPAAEVGLNIRPDATVEFAPGVGSYVGGDITAGLLCTDLLTDSESVFLFLDIGTNGEIVIGNADWLVACACSAGPAFEGAGIKCGMRAAAGAIEQIEIGKGGRDVKYQVIGGGEPDGVCGSGLICLIGELFRRGLIDAAGRFNPDPGNPRLVRSGQQMAFLIERGEHTRGGDDLVITEADIENLIRTKAAIYAACSLVLANVGLDWKAIGRVYIAGGFGRYIRVSEAILIGMLPDLPHGRFSYIGNSALTGAYIALLSREHRDKLAETASRMTYLDLSSDPRYMDSYVKAMFLPHTELAQFPSVQQILNSERGEII